MRPERASAALLLAAGLFAAALPRAGDDPGPCVRPAETLAVDGRTRHVGCDGGPALRGPARSLFGLRIDPNRADAATLETLPGIGPARAAAIVAERQRGRFDAPGDLRRVRGIGSGTLRRIEGWLSVPREGTGADGR